MATSPAVDQPARSPRVFAIPQAKGPDDDPPARNPKPQRAKAKQRSAKLSAADHVRIRTLTEYGMTPEQVAEHYEVSVEIIQRSLAATTGM
jgi:hypothetical protein